MTFRSFGRKLKKISNKSPKKYFEKFLVENGRDHNSAKNQYFFDLVSNIAISSKSNGGYFFYSFEKLFFLGAWVLNNFFSGNFFQKWSIFAVFRLFHPKGGQIRKIYWGGDSVSGVYGSNGTGLGIVSHSVRALGPFWWTIFWGVFSKLIYHLVGEPNGDYPNFYSGFSFFFT